jgi:hypothetical protein
MLVESMSAGTGLPLPVPTQVVAALRKNAWEDEQGNGHGRGRLHRKGTQALGLAYHGSFPSLSRNF